MLLAAILWLAPSLGLAQAEHYAALIDRYATDVDPLLVAAIIKVESRYRRRTVSRTDDYGLMQLHVSETTHERWLGRERELLEPARNVRLGVRMLRYWRRWHLRKCKGGHAWWAHYNWGARIGNRRYERKVGKLYRALLGAQ